MTTDFGGDLVESPEVAAVLSPYDERVCHTNLVASFKDLFGDVLDYVGNRALVFSVGTQLPEQELRACIEMALTYHQTKKPSAP